MYGREEDISEEEGSQQRSRKEVNGECVWLEPGSIVNGLGEEQWAQASPAPWSQPRGPGQEPRSLAQCFPGAKKTFHE